MTAKGKTEPLSPVDHMTRYPRELWDDMQEEIGRRLDEQHRDDSMADLIREAVRAYRAIGWGRTAKVA